jgi:hypothetical protein
MTVTEPVMPSVTRLRSLAAALALLVAVPAAAADRPAARLCFFSYNHAAEYETVSRFVAQLNRHAPVRTEVVELQAFDADPEDAIRAAARSGLRCDGLVLSGHQRKRKFWGERSDGSIKTRHFEALSCANDSAGWFQEVRAVWLQGCNTGRQALLNPAVKPKKRIDGSPLPLLQAGIDLRDLEDSLEDINDRLEANLNEDNIAVDYLRIFPAATLYTWTNKAPGEKAGSQYSLPYHVAQVSRLAGAPPALYEDPRGRLSPAAARRYGEVLYAMLTGVALDAKGLTEANFLKGWQAHGDYRQKYAFDNHELKAFPALLHADADILRLNRGLRCLLQTYKGRDRAEDLVAYIAEHDHHAPYNDLMLLALLDKAADQPELQQRLQGRLAGSGRLMQYLAQTKDRPAAASLHQRLRSAATALAGQPEGSVNGDGMAVVPPQVP